MTAAPGGALWLGLDPGDLAADERHVEHEVLELLDALGLQADLVCTHVVQRQDLSRVAATARVLGREADPLDERGLLVDLLARWSGAVVLAGEADAPTVEAGPAPLRGGAREALEQVRSGTGGRAARFPGQDALVEPLSVLQVPIVSAVVTVIPAAGEVTSASVLDPSGHVRPHFEDGRLVLAVRPGRDGTVMPVEKLENHSCAGH